MAETKINMEYRHLGNTGLKVSVISYGNMVNWEPEKFDNDFEIIKYLTDNGVNFIDTAEMYQDGKAETQLGKILKKLNKPREELVISTKIWKCGEDINSKTTTSRKHIIEGALNSLKRLQLDYVDVIFCHRHDYETPMEEICRAMNWLIENNKAFYWGTSEWNADAIVEAHAVCDRLGLIHPVVEQPQYNILARERFEVEYAPLFDKFKMGTTIWSPLAMGILTGKYNDGNIPEGARFSEGWGKAGGRARFYDPMMEGPRREKTIAALKGLGEIAKELGITQTQLALAWTLKNKDVSTALIGARTLAQAQDSLPAVNHYSKITKEIDERIEKLFETRPDAPFNWKTWQPFAPRR